MWVKLELKKLAIVNIYFLRYNEISTGFYLRFTIKRSLSNDLIRCQGNKNDSEYKSSDFVLTSLFIHSLFITQLQRLLSFFSPLHIGNSVSTTLLSISALLTAWFFNGRDEQAHYMLNAERTKYRL